MANYTNSDPRIEATARKVDEGKRDEPALVRCRACRKSRGEVLAMIELRGFVFCQECIETAATAVARKSGR